MPSPPHDLQTLVDRIPHLVYIARGVDGGGEEPTFVFLNGAAADFGLTVREDGSAPVAEFMAAVHPDDLDGLNAAGYATMTSGVPFEHRFRLLPVAGFGERWIESKGNAHRDTDGQPALMGTMTDITALKAAEERLAVEQRRMEIATRVGGVGIWETRFADGVYIWSDQMYRLYGRDASQYTGDLDQWVSILHPDDRDRVLREWSAAAEQGEAFDSEFRILRPDGTLRHMLAHATVMSDASGRPTGAIGVNLDVTEDRLAHARLAQALDAAKAAERAKSDFLATMSHEIRTPMNTVLGMTRLALRTDLKPKQRDYLSKIEMSARALIAIINDILDLSRIEAGGLELESTEFTIESMLASVAAVTGIKADEKGLEMVFATDPDLPRSVVGDPLRIGQVLINLVGNAVKFTDEGEVVVTADVLAGGDPEMGTLRVSVRDTGVGMEPDQMERIFDAFTQADSTTSRTHGGTGLGLTICRRLVEMMGGRIWAESAAGLGSTFTFTAKVGLPTSRRGRGTLTADGTSRRVLIVDDNPSARRVLGDMVRGFGFEVDATRSAREGLQRLRESTQGAPFDLVLMDWRMPEMDGLEAAEVIKADSDLDRTPAVLMVTAYGREEVLSRAEQLGLEGVLIKPVTASLLLETMTEVLDLPAELRAAVSTEGEVDRTVLQGRRALVVDDHALSRELVGELLREVKMVTVAAATGEEAIARAESVAEPFDIILMDIELGAVDGAEVANQIRRSARYANVPVVAMTGHTGPEARRRVLEAGMDDHIEKPIEADLLHAALVRLLPGSDRFASLADKRALVVDDNPLNRELAAELLEEIGMVTEAASDGQEALQRLREQRFDVVLMDIQMPVMDGLTATRAIRADSALAELPVIALTAQAQAADRIASLDAGVDAHLSKPIEDSELYEAVLRLVVRGDAATEDAGETASSAPAATSGDGAAIDADAALARIGGRRDRLLRLARGFIRDFADMAQRVRVAHEAGDLPTVAGLAHQVKGTAGYLAAARLTAAAAALEKAARADDAARALEEGDRFVAELERVLAAAAELVAQDERSGPRTGADLGRAAELIESALPLVATGNYDAVAVLEALVDALAGTDHHQLAEAALEHFDGADLHAATAAIERLQAALG